jgi:HD-GYP domain-containing protein (c-di-GMP phosphodiesterase class II)
VTKALPPQPNKSVWSPSVPAISLNQQIPEQAAVLSRKQILRSNDHLNASSVPSGNPDLPGFDGADLALFHLARSVEQRDSSLARHCERLALMSSAIGLLLGLPAESIRTLHRSGFIHDIGKISLPDSILLKPAPLDADEWKLMKTHPVRGEEICRPVVSLAPVLPIIRHHHEHWDGSGYPDGLAGEEIPLLARILQMADIYDALTSERPYKKPFSPTEAIKIMKEETRRGWRDPFLMPLVEAALPLFESPQFWEQGSLSLASLAASVGSWADFAETKNSF